jgi:CheY-like chemotaxis protein
MSPTSASPRKIVVIEDSDDLLEMTRELLERQGHTVYTARSGLEGVTTILANQPDVALVDVGMPELDGYEVARRVRADPGGRRVFLVALTGFTHADAKARAQSAGFDLHFAKPIDIARLHEVIQRATPSPQ